MQPIVIGDASLYLGDSNELAPAMGFFDALVTDPPYEFKTAGGGKFRKARKNLDQIIESELDKGFDFSIVNPLLYNQAVVFCHNDQLPELMAYMRGSFVQSCLLCAWHKENPMPVRNKHYLPDTEFYIHAWNKGGHPIGAHEHMKRFHFSKNGKSKFGHPTVKPDALMDKIMANVSGETIIDPFMGTASTGIAALKAGKKFTGIEKSHKYFDIACRRIEQFYKNK